MKTITVIFLFAWINIFAQTENFSTHSVELFVNGKAQKIHKIEATIFTQKDTILGVFKNKNLIFPVIDSPFVFRIRVNGFSILSNEITNLHFINYDGHIILGQVKKFKKLQTVASQNGNNNTDPNWLKHSNSFYVVEDSNYLLEVDNWNKMKGINFVIFNPEKTETLLTIQQEIK